jgi:hypothetical protein
MKFRPDFNNYFNGEWNYNQSEGVGLKLTGYPTNVNKFIELLHNESCNPVATRRILKELNEKKIKYTTLMSHLNFNYIGDQLKEIGVIMEIIPPAPSNKIQNAELDYLAFDLFQNKQQMQFIQLGEIDKKEIEERLAIFKESFDKHQSDFGPYDRDYNISNQSLEKARKKKFNYELKAN